MSERKRRTEDEPEQAADTETAAAVYQDHVVEPSDETAEEPATIEVPKGHKLLRYDGAADVVKHGEYTFRDGKPVAVPSEVAETLLTMPDETFVALE